MAVKRSIFRAGSTCAGRVRKLSNVLDLVAEDLSEKVTQALVGIV